MVSWILSGIKSVMRDVIFSEIHFSPADIEMVASEIESTFFLFHV